ncbi:MAG: imidazole glycerol phosphate synthase subunit HisH [Magnetococcales bacterium]|nr:imidazole glycerol phosphate synthase subunit HisH [Magnetococcales bacterium]
MIVVIDYGSGNLRSVAKALERVGGQVCVSSCQADIERADHLVLPGVGAFADCRHNLQHSGLVDPLLCHVQQGKPFLGICVGMQLLFSVSHEFGCHDGFGLIPGVVQPFAANQIDPQFPDRRLKVPHMGWNQVQQTRSHPLWSAIPDWSHFYFVHSYYGQPEHGGDTAAVSNYGIPFTAAVAKGNLFATQFHPEKSQKHGLQLLHNFINWNGEEGRP